MFAAIALIVVTAALSYGAANAMRHAAARLGFTDVPNQRSLHVRVTPRAGGIGFAFIVPAAIAVGDVLLGIPLTGPLVAVLIAAPALALVSLIDDRSGLPALVRFIAQGAAACGVVASGAVLREIVIPGRPPIHLGAWGPIVAIAWIVFLTNIYNFMDGIDGLAASQAVIAAAAIAVMALWRDRSDVALAMALTGGGVAGFLALNWPPARIFMGDVGSTFLGFFFAAWAVLSSGDGASRLPFAAWAAVLSPFLFDAALTLVRRAIRGEPIHQAHRTHLYQRLVAGGWTHARTTILYSALAAFAAALTLLYYGTGLMAPAVYAAAVLLPLSIPLLLAHHRKALS